MAGSEGGGGQRTTSPARMGWSEPLIAPTCTIAHTASGPKSSRALLSPATGSGCTTSAQACLPPAPSSMAGPAQNPPSHPPPEVPGATRDCAAYRSCASAAVEAGASKQRGGGAHDALGAVDQHQREDVAEPTPGVDRAHDRGLGHGERPPSCQGHAAAAAPREVGCSSTQVSRGQLQAGRALVNRDFHDVSNECAMRPTARIVCAMLALSLLWTNCASRQSSLPLHARSSTPRSSRPRCLSRAADDEDSRGQCATVYPLADEASAGGDAGFVVLRTLPGGDSLYHAVALSLRYTRDGEVGSLFWSALPAVSMSLRESVVKCFADRSRLLHLGGAVIIASADLVDMAAKRRLGAGASSFDYLKSVYKLGEYSG
eukprot:CAMPEP_0179924336 /NCGR_PEP_ID=MMETSP0983-20121128/6658_1 /TAXON_ID=483367 /ORGANISM="non described non described, Strain CCMP 2436" /LENGTH=372 /DNA_ID=CAMNT_0021827823 /DNA_START=1599 /DNA_END=2714 /DNA_ORIENTATION=+